MLAAACVALAGNGVHSSKAMTMSEPSSRWISMLRSGLRRCMRAVDVAAEGHPLLGQLAQLGRLITWNPPELVRIGRSQFMKRCSPPSRATRSAPGRSIR